MSKKEYANTDFAMFFRALAVNALGGAIVFLAYRGGWIRAVLEADTVYISRFIAGLGLIGLSAVLMRIFKVSRELNVARKYHQLVKAEGGKLQADIWLESTGSRVAEFVRDYRGADSGDRPVLVDQFKLVMASKNAFIGAAEEWLVILGLIGTVVGIRLGTGTIDPEAFRSIDLLVPLLKQVLGALFIAFDTTIVGASSALLLDINLKWVLRPGTVQVVNEAIRMGVLHHE